MNRPRSRLALTLGVSIRLGKFTPPKTGVPTYVAPAVELNHQGIALRDAVGVDLVWLLRSSPMSMLSRDDVRYMSPYNSLLAGGLVYKFTAAPFMFLVLNLGPISL